MQIVVFYSAGIYLVHIMGQVLNEIGKNKTKNLSQEAYILLGGEQTNRYKHNMPGSHNYQE